jgi:hypothetical protein
METEAGQLKGKGSIEDCSSTVQDEGQGCLSNLPRWETILIYKKKSNRCYLSGDPVDTV